MENNKYFAIGVKHHSNNTKKQKFSSEHIRELAIEKTLNEAIKDGVVSIEYVKENKKELIKLLRKI
jgi:hypothetical protein